MTTWTRYTAGTKIWSTTHGKFKKQHFIITGISGDTGGTIATKFNKILNVDTTVETATTAVVHRKRVTGKSVVVAYADPTEGHTVEVEVLGA